MIYSTVGKLHRLLSPTLNFCWKAPVSRNTLYGCQLRLDSTIVVFDCNAGATSDSRRFLLRSHLRCGSTRSGNSLEGTSAPSGPKTMGAGQTIVLTIHNLFVSTKLVSSMEKEYAVSQIYELIQDLPTSTGGLQIIQRHYSSSISCKNTICSTN